MIECPKCASIDTRLSRCQSPLESWRRQLLATSPYRCARCGWRGWVPDAKPQQASQPSAAPVPAVSLAASARMPLPAAPPRRDELDFHLLNIPHGPLHSRTSF